jgi:hypothetical protein
VDAEQRQDDDGCDRRTDASDHNHDSFPKRQGPRVIKENAPKTAAEMSEQKKCHQRIVGNQPSIP